jgi:hypothetical protein
MGALSSFDFERKISFVEEFVSPIVTGTFDLIIPAFSIAIFSRVSQADPCDQN